MPRGANQYPAWTPFEEAALRAAYDTDGLLDLDGIAASLGRSRASVATKANALGLTRATRPRLADQGRMLRDWRASNPHPRGALGMHHTYAAREAMSEARRARWAGMSLDERTAIGRKAAVTRLEVYGTGNPTPGANAYSRARRGRREDLGGVFYRSAWEANYARYLRFLAGRGDIRSWEYEPERFRFEGVSRGPYTYLPDFRVTEPDGTVTYHEVKGWLDSKSRSQLRRMAKFYPEVRIVLIDHDVYRAISKFSSLIAGWEE